MSNWGAITDGIHEAGIRHFGQTATYTPAAGGGPFTIEVEFKLDAERTSFDSGFEVVERQPRATVRIADLPAEPAVDDTLVIGGVSYRVMVTEPDGGGGTDLFLHRSV